ncbi:hypothetical protein GCM10027443_29880 [Pontibacter brevis]
MEYKYMKISHEAGKTVGTKTYSDNEADSASGDLYPRALEILQQEEMIGGEAALTPAKLENGYYPIEYFKPIYFAANTVLPGEDIKPRTSRHCYEYVGPDEA